MAARDVATPAGGCFWCVEAAFKDLIGVDTVVFGYMGGHVDNPTYRQICSGDTGHAEVIQIGFDPAQPYCAAIVAPKVAKARAHFRALLKGAD